MIRCYDDFVEALLNSGFSMDEGSPEDVYAVITWRDNKSAPYQTPVYRNSGDIDTDPCKWQARILKERSDIAHGKLFHGKSGFITKEWYPYFLASRRCGGRTFDEAYSSGLLCDKSAEIYNLILKHGALPTYTIRQLMGLSNRRNLEFDAALNLLQMKLFLTVCEKQKKTSRSGVESGNLSNIFCTTESFFGEDVFEKARRISKSLAYIKIRKQTIKLNPMAKVLKVLKFIYG